MLLLIFNVLCFLKALRGIKVLVHAISKIQLMPSQLTSIHSDLCQVGNRWNICLVSHMCFLSCYAYKYIYTM